MIHLLLFLMNNDDKPSNDEKETLKTIADMINGESLHMCMVRYVTEYNEGNLITEFASQACCVI